jgi:hypothetical protein
VRRVWCRLWDLSLEKDPEEERDWEATREQLQAEAPSDLPAQLLFVHQVRPATDLKGS